MSRRDPDHVQRADRFPYFGEREPMLDLNQLEELRAAEELHQPDPNEGHLDLDALDQAAADDDDDFFDADTVLEPDDFADDDRLTLCFTCSVCTILPVDPIKGQVTCNWCLSRCRS
jgi:hypothetical protein